MKWSRGDLGRFKSEASKQPRFEVVGKREDTSHVVIWYSGEKSPTTLPIATFKRDCTSTWELTAVIKELPKWLREGALVHFANSGPMMVRQVEIGGGAKNKWGGIAPPDTTVSIDLAGKQVLVRSIRRDFASVMLENTLQMVPLKVLMRGFVRLTKYQALDEDPFGTESGGISLEDLADLFDD